jgi:hypothetical protein
MVTSCLKGQGRSGSFQEKGLVAFPTSGPPRGYIFSGELLQLWRENVLALCLRSLNPAQLCVLRRSNTNEGMISIEPVRPEEWKVTIQGATRTEHRVRVRAVDIEGLFPESPPAVEKLIEESFRFLLEREPNTAILPSFELPVIGRYFPEYPHEIVKRIRRCK